MARKPAETTFTLIGRLLCAGLVILAVCGGGGGAADTDRPSAFEGQTVTLSWDPPTEYTDGTPMPPSRIAGYRIHVGDSPGNYTVKVDIGNIRFITVRDLPPLVCYVALTVYDFDGNESDLSNEICVVVQ